MAGVIVVKYGGSAMEDPAKVSDLLREIAGLALEGYPIVVVHGGGKAISAELAKRGIKPVFVDGLRVTDEESIKVVEEVLDRNVNPDIVEKVRQAGAKARGLSGREVFRAKTISKALGRVGEVEGCEVAKVRKCLQANETAVVSPVSLGEDGGALNVNADVAASALAGALQAEQLIFLSDVPGLMRDPKNPATLIREIRVGELADLEKGGVIGGGMMPKCRSAAAALKRGLAKVEFVDGRVAGTLTKVVKGQEKAGTVLRAD